MQVVINVFVDTSYDDNDFLRGEGTKLIPKKEQWKKGLSYFMKITENRYNMLQCRMFYNSMKSYNPMQNCQICEKEAKFICGDCESVAYCSSEHRADHWRAHKEQCKVIRGYREKQLEENADKKRLEIRKRYFEHYAHNIYDVCIPIAQELFLLEKNHLELTRQLHNQLNYGVAVCLLAKTYLLVEKANQANICIDAYLRERNHFLEDRRDLQSLKTETKLTKSSQKFMTQKLELIAQIASLCSHLKRDCMPYYKMYAAHVELIFGSDSLELSNVFFCVGNYYREKNEYMKAIACFVRTAGLRGKKGGDCYINIALLYRQLGKHDIGLSMMAKAVKINQDEFGANSPQAAESQEKKGLMYLDVLDYNNAIACLEAALKIHINQKDSDQYKRIKDRIGIVYRMLQNQLDSEKREKSSLKGKKQEEENGEADLQKIRENKLKKTFDINKIFRISEHFLDSLKDLELYKFSELQIELSHCHSDFAVAYTVNNSNFLKCLSENRLRQLKAENKKLFELMNLEHGIEPIAEVTG